MAERMNLAAWSGVLGTWVSIAAAGAGGYAALRTYDDEVAKMEDARVVQTFSLFELFNSAEVMQSRQRVMDGAIKGTPTEERDLWVTLDFYDAVEVCVKRNLCDQELAVRLFQPYAVPIWSSLGSGIVQTRIASDPNAGGGMEWMASLPVPARVTSAPVESEDAASSPQTPPNSEDSAEEEQSAPTE